MQNSENKAEVVVAKQRHGPTGYSTGAFRKAIHPFYRSYRKHPPAPEFLSHYA